MISFEITRRKAQPTVVKLPAAPDEEGTLFQRIAARRVRLQQNPQLSSPINLDRQPIVDAERLPEAYPRMHPVGMGKVAYTKWLDEHVVSKFPKGALVTLCSMPFVPDHPPSVWFKVSFHQEVHYMADYDKNVGQPKCVGLELQTKPNGSSFPIYYAPALLRALQPEEYQAIDRLRDQKSERRDDPSAGLDGTEQSVDRSTGESS